MVHEKESGEGEGRRRRQGAIGDRVTTTGTVTGEDVTVVCVTKQKKAKRKSLEGKEGGKNRQTEGDE